MMVAAIACGFGLQAVAQDSTKAGSFTISGYAEAYYLYDANRPLNNTRPGFVYSHNRANEVNVNLAFLKGTYNAERLRASLAIGAGTYMNANMAAEPGVLKNIYEANAGVKLLEDSQSLAGCRYHAFAYRFRTAPSEKITGQLTRSMAADNSPYYEAGAKLGYTSKNEKWYLAALYLNGWQRIQRIDGNSTPAFGTQVTFKPSSSVTLNYSTFAGNDKPDSVRLMRYFHNVYGIFTVSEKFGLTAGFDYGMEQKEKGKK